MTYDVAIIGAGPAGITASLYTKRANLKTLVLYKDESSLEKADIIENYYGFKKGISGKELYQEGIEQEKKSVHQLRLILTSRAVAKSSSICSGAA